MSMFAYVVLPDGKRIDERIETQLILQQKLEESEEKYQQCIKRKKEKQCLKK